MTIWSQIKNRVMPAKGELVVLPDTGQPGGAKDDARAALRTMMKANPALALAMRRFPQVSADAKEALVESQDPGLGNISPIWTRRGIVDSSDAGPFDATDAEVADFAMRARAKCAYGNKARSMTLDGSGNGTMIYGANGASDWRVGTIDVALISIGFTAPLTGSSANPIIRLSGIFSDAGAASWNPALIEFTVQDSNWCEVYVIPYVLDGRRATPTFLRVSEASPLTVRVETAGPNGTLRVEAVSPNRSRWQQVMPQVLAG